MPKLTQSVPKYRKHRVSGQAVVSIGGRDYYLGPYRTKASRIEYDRVIAEWLAGGRHPLLSDEDRAGITVAELIARYWQFVKTYYVKDGRPTDSQAHIRLVLKALRKTHARVRVADFGPLGLKAIRERLVVSGSSRKYINTQIGRLVQMFTWGVAEELVPPSVHQALRAVSGLRKGRTKAPDPEPVTPVADAIVEATLLDLGPVVTDMVRFQRFTG